MNLDICKKCKNCDSLMISFKRKYGDAYQPFVISYDRTYFYDEAPYCQNFDLITDMTKYKYKNLIRYDDMTKDIIVSKNCIYYSEHLIQELNKK